MSSGPNFWQTMARAGMPHYVRDAQLPQGTVKQKAGRLGDLLLDYVPILGDIKGAGEAIGGRSALTQEPLSKLERVLSGIGVLPFIPGIGAQIKAFHGSPHKFNKFSTKAIGTGEGAQAFGWGLYFTDKPSIAKHYSESTQMKGLLTARDKNGKIIYQGAGWDDGALEAAKWVETGRKQAGEFTHNTAHWAKKAYAKSFARYPEMLEEPSKQAVLNKIDELAEAKITYEDVPGSVYDVLLHKGKKPSEYDYLRWDEPLTEAQKNKIIKQRYIERGYTVKGNKWFNQKGEQIPDEYVRKQIAMDKEKMVREGEYVYGALSREMRRKAKSGMSMETSNQKEASLFLKRAGIDGIKYPSGSLTGMKSKGSYNYVVFDEADVSIEAMK
jgi:hypothetical protein